MRRISTGIVGREILGRFTAFDNSLRSIENNQDIVLNPNGTGIIRSDAHIQVNNENSVRFADSGSSNYVEIKAPASLGSNVNLTLPSNTGSDGNALLVDASGNLSFGDISVDITNQSADTDTYYPVITTTTSGGLTSASVSSSKLSFQPSSGILTVNALSTNDVDIGGGSIDGTVIGASNAAAGTFSSITETSSAVLKDNIEPLTGVLGKVTALQGVSYTRIATGKKEAGLIAEDVEKIIPEIVDETEYKSISYSRITAYLIEAIRELQQELETVKNG